MISAGYHDLLNAPNTAVLASSLPDGTPQASPVWFLFDDNKVMVSTTADRQKHRDVRQRPHSPLSIR